MKFKPFTIYDLEEVYEVNKLSDRSFKVLKYLVKNRFDHTVTGRRFGITRESVRQMRDRFYMAQNYVRFLKRKVIK